MNLKLALKNNKTYGNIGFEFFDVNNKLGLQQQLGPVPN